MGKLYWAELNVETGELTEGEYDAAPYESPFDYLNNVDEVESDLEINPPRIWSESPESPRKARELISKEVERIYSMMGKIRETDFSL